MALDSVFFCFKITTSDFMCVALSYKNPVICNAIKLALANSALLCVWNWTMSRLTVSKGNKALPFISEHEICSYAHVLK